VFIVGMSRAGTTWLAKCLGQHSDVSVFGETAFWGKRFVAPSNGAKLSRSEIERLVESLKSVRILHAATSWYDPACPKLLDLLNDQRELLFRTPMDPGEFFRFILQRIALQANTKCVIEKTPHHINWANRILKYLPDARFIVHIREPYGFMRSYKHQGDRKSADVKRAFHRRYHPLACAVVWRGYIRSITELLSAYPDRTIAVRYEELQADGNKVLDEVQSFLQLRPMDLNLPSENSSFPTGVKPELSPCDIFAMNLCARREIRRAGFRQLPSPGSWGEKAAAIASLPWWAAANYASLNRVVQGSLFDYLLRWLK
jgi:hypothetical protein